jgi:hypothetical protein
MPKPVFDQDVECQYCGKLNRVKVTREVEVPAVPAEYTLEVLVTRAGKQEKIG